MVEDPIHPCAGSSLSKMAVWLRETREQLDGIHYSGVNSSANVCDSLCISIFTLLTLGSGSPSSIFSS